MTQTSDPQAPGAGGADAGAPPRPGQARALRFGWTTGACACAAALGAARALLTGRADEGPVQIRLPRGGTARFDLAELTLAEGWARAGVVKDAGDDPDVTHGALVRARVSQAAPGTGVRFAAGEGVGVVTLPGLPLPPGEPAINPTPRAMIKGALRELAQELGAPADFEVEISIPGGEALAARTWNPRLGIVGGLSILGTTGIVRPFSCAAWIASIHRGVDVARATGLTHAVAATGATSERAAARLYPALPPAAFLDMGDFAGGLLKYLRRHPLPRLTIAGGFAKLTKLAQGALDLHSSRSQVDMARLAALAEALGADGARIRAANTALEALTIAGPRLAEAVARDAAAAALAILNGAPVEIEAIVVGRDGAVLARTPFAGPGAARTP
ncbi:cobalt-precorrin-5B (C(1))-methyltransferase [Oceanicella actignis]|uniref:cobalt-precorrin-5B (C(1))-methyltransferase n=1 Tax=Oceanicella actignis TaxID=1189325 RepID=UPI0011E7E8CB|nr:cobalt-precorrin-5B (C(1))-methyltransferase [Oceanicella actignis]TYO90875.1 cobalt-precorrin-5B (C1)-methyltransferase [Oceanicella actignis]